MENKTARAWDYALERQFAAGIDDLTEALASGAADDFAHYRYLCGQIRGIRFAIDALIGIRQRFGVEEDEDA